MHCCSLESYKGFTEMQVLYFVLAFGALKQFFAMFSLSGLNQGSASPLLCLFHLHTFLYFIYIRQAAVFESSDIKFKKYIYEKHTNHSIFYVSKQEQCYSKFNMYYPSVNQTSNISFYCLKKATQVSRDLYSLRCTS